MIALSYPLFANARRLTGALWETTELLSYRPLSIIGRARFVAHGSFKYLILLI